MSRHSSAPEHGAVAARSAPGRGGGCHEDGLPPALWLATSVAAILIALYGCHDARMLAPPPPIRAASANNFGVEVEFAESLDRASAEDATRYRLYRVGQPQSPEALYSATLVDTLYGRVVLLLVASSPLADSAWYELKTSDVRSLEGRSTGELTTTFLTGLRYALPLAALFDTQCNACHGPETADGNYRTDSYPALFGNGSDSTRNLTPGDPNSRLVVKTQPRGSMFNRGKLSYLDSEMIRNWVVSYQARP